MKKIGIDLGASTLKVVVISNNIEKTIIKKHYGDVIASLIEVLEIIDQGHYSIGITGSQSGAFEYEIEPIQSIPAIIEGMKYLGYKEGSIIEIGSQSACFITDFDHPRFNINEQCAGGTGSFFEDQMGRLGLDIEDYSSIVSNAKSILSVSGRCAVFAKTDIIHRQQEGVSKEDILLGLCYAMVRNYKATIVKGLSVEKPVYFIGGVTENKGVSRAIREVFKLDEDELIIPDYACFISAIGAGKRANNDISLEDLIVYLKNEEVKSLSSHLPVLKLMNNPRLEDPLCDGNVDEGVYLGIDIGSTSTNLVLMDRYNKLADYLYLRTKGDPEKAVRDGLMTFYDRYGDLLYLGVGVTGSGRERLGRMMGADIIKDEITAQAKAAAFYVEDVDTVFEIGGQDSKYISIRDGEVVDFQMNKICAAGTGSFIEEQALRMDLSLDEFGKLALRGDAPCDLGERCTVFIESSIHRYQSLGASQENIVSGLCHSIVKNYLHKVVAGKKVGGHIALQGGVDYNPGIVAAFQSVYGERIRVSPVFSISGACGVALIASETVAKSHFLGVDFPHTLSKDNINSLEIKRNKEFYKKAGELILEDYDDIIDPNKKTVGVPLSLIIFKFFPMINAFFTNLGYNVILSGLSNEETIQLSQESARGETCYPIKLMYGHMRQLANKGVDYIFMPSIRTIKHPHAHAAHNYACPYMQSAGRFVYDTLDLKSQGIELLNPVLDFDLGQQMMAKAMIQVGKQLGHSKPKCMIGLTKGAKAVNANTTNIEKLGQELLDSLKPDEKVLVLITRNYGISDPVLNMGIPELLLDRGYKVITLGHLPGMSLDISKDYPNMYWPFGDHILSGAKLIKNHPQLYAIYLTNHGCGPDTIISHLFKEEMGDKPYLQIEVDEHFSKVGVITRIEAFLNTLEHVENKFKSDDFNILNVEYRPTNITNILDSSRTLYIPDYGYYSEYLVYYFNEMGIDTEIMKISENTLAIGKSFMDSKEYLPLVILTGSCIEYARKNDHGQFMIPYNYGADADGQYPRVIRSILDTLGYHECQIFAPMIEEISENCKDLNLLNNALKTGDLVYQLPYDSRDSWKPDYILSDNEMNQFKDIQSKGKKIGIIGDPMCLASLGNDLLEVLERKGYYLIRMSFHEMMNYSWKENDKVNHLDHSQLLDISKKNLGMYAGNFGNYRFAKAIELSEKCDAIIHIMPRYENTAMVLQLRGIMNHCGCPYFEIALDGEVDDTVKEHLSSFLYYV